MKHQKTNFKPLDTVWNHEKECFCIVKEVLEFDDDDNMIVVYVNDSDGTYVMQGLPWEFEKIESFSDKKIDGSIGFAKFRADAVIPTKNHYEDAGYDVYLNFPKDATWTDEDGVKIPAWNKDKLTFRVQKNKPTLLPTGVGVRVSPDFYTDWANERGSTGLRGMATLSGVVDSGYRGEVFLDICPLYKEIVFTNTVNEIIETADEIFFPVTKAVAQMIPRRNLHLTEYQISLEDFEDDKTNRGSSKLGQSGK